MRRRGVVRIATMLAIPLLLTLLVGVAEMTRLLAGMISQPVAVETQSRFALNVAEANSRELHVMNVRP